MYEGSLCVCCMSTNDLMDLFEVRRVHHFEETYAKLIHSCLNIELSPSAGHDSICTACVTSLNDCAAFKRQVLKTLVVISSVDLLQLINEEDMAILGFLKYEPDSKNTNSTVNQSPEVEIEVVEEPLSPDPPEAKPKQKRVGRPKTFKNDGIPYVVRKHERECRECGQEFHSYLALKAHYNTHFANHICNVCKKGFASRTSLLKHQKIHREGPFTCDMCKMVFRNLNTLSSHKRFKHGGHKRTPPVDPFPCPHCGRIFKWACDRTRHIQTQHEHRIRLHTCPKCGLKLKYAALRKHMLAQHNIDKNYKCSECSAALASWGALATHLRSHWNVRRFVCKLCNKAFVQKVTLKYHIGAHIRRGEYSGDPQKLVVINSERNHGMLSQYGSPQYLDEDLLSSDPSLEKDHMKSEFDDKHDKSDAGETYSDHGDDKYDKSDAGETSSDHDKDHDESDANSDYYDKHDESDAGETFNWTFQNDNHKSDLEEDDDDTRIVWQNEDGSDMFEKSYT